MKKYHKIQTIFLRNPATKFKTLLDGYFALPEFKYLKNNEWMFTEKVDGTNIRIIYENQEIKFAGKTDKAQLYPGLLKKLKEIFNPLLSEFKYQFGEKSVCLYGEGYGDKIQKGKKYSLQQNFVLFDVMIDNLFLDRINVERISESFNIDCVPVIGIGTISDMVSLVKEGFPSTWGNFTAEGVVARPLCELNNREGRRIITKLKYKDFPR